ncbi:MAG: CRISPR-associated helicase Cas3' [Anaerolineae bacterium]
MRNIMPYPYQEQVASLLLERKSVILQAPTGAGKTIAALLPFFHAWRDESDIFFPRKCIYVVPMRVLANQFVLEAQKVVDSFARRFRHKPVVTIQTGERPEDRRFEGDLVFCTIDQFLSSYLTFPYGLPHRWANLNAGAFVGAYIVCDEFHLLDPDSTLPSALYALKQLRHLAPVLVMTATFSRDMLTALARQLHAETVALSLEEARAIEMRGGAITPRQRVWRTAATSLTAAAVLEAHQTRSLVLCNTVQRAQTLYHELQACIENVGKRIEVLLLHSRFLSADRKRIEDELRAHFGKAADRSGSWIAVATQAIEVGVDITCETLHTELAPASSLIQRAGRCARFPGEQGEVRVYPVESYAPYGKEAGETGPDPAWVVEMKAAWTWLQEHSGAALDFAGEQALINAVATPRDRAVLAGIQEGEPARAAAIQSVLRGNSPDTRLLVRDADSRLVLLHETPDTLLRNPYGAIGFNIQRMTLYGMVKGWLEREGDFPWRVLSLEEILPGKSGDGEENGSRYRWKPLTSTKDVSGARVLAVHPALAGYLADEGFVADRGVGEFRSTLPPDADKVTWERPRYRLESYAEHTRHVLGAFADVALPELRYAAPALEHAADWPAGSLTQAAWLVCLFHDVGKLSVGWQTWARAYQKHIGAPVAATFAAAHTDFEPGDVKHKTALKVVGHSHPKPNHAAESALAVGPVLVEALAGNESLVRAALTAIARHHTPCVDEGQKYELEAQAGRHLAEAVRYLPVELQSGLNLGRVQMKGRGGPVLVASPDDLWAWLAYLLLARALRRADQTGTERGTREAA